MASRFVTANASTRTTRTFQLVAGCDQHPPADSVKQSAAAGTSATRPCGLTAEPVLTDSGIGRLRLRASVTEIHRECEVVADTVRVSNDTDERQPVLFVQLGQDTVAAAIDSEDRVSRIFIDRGRLRTRDGIGIGTPLAQVLDRPGVYGGVGESALYLTVPPYCGLSFALSEAGEYEHGDKVDPVQLRGLPPSTRVERINIGPCAH